MFTCTSRPQMQWHRSTGHSVCRGRYGVSPSPTNLTVCVCVQVWAQWTGHYEARLVQSGQLAIAARHWELRLKRPVVRAWCDYVKLRRRKLYLKRVAIGARNSTLLLTSYSHWKIQFLRNRKMAEFEDLIVHKSKLSILRRSLVQWRLCILTTPL